MPSPLTVDRLPDELTAALEAERRRVAAAAAAGRERLRQRLDALEAAVMAGAGNEVRRTIAVEPANGPAPVSALVEDWAPPQAPAPPGAPAPSEVAPPEIAPAEPASPPVQVAPPTPHKVSYPGLVASRRLLVVGAVVLLFVAHERWVSPWVARNGQARLRSDGAAVLSIPKLRAAFAVAEGTSLSALRQGPGHDSRSSPLGGRGNIVIAGHRTTYGQPFARLSRLKNGDTIMLTAGKSQLAYTVQSVRDDVAPGDRSSRAQPGDDRLTLVTASSRGRMVVAAVAAGGERPGALPPKGRGGGPLWPTSTTAALALVAFWTGAAVLVPRAVRHLRGRRGHGSVLLVWLPVATLVTFELMGAGERFLGILY